MTKEEKEIRDFCAHHADWWPSVSQVREIMALAQQQQRPWQSLTDEEYKEILKQHDGAGLLTFYNLVEAKLKEKNT